MAKKYTVMIFDNSQHGKSKTYVMTRIPLFITIALVLVLMTTSAVFGYLYFKYSDENALLASKASTDSSMERKINEYADKMELLSDKLGVLDELEFKVRDLISFQNSGRVLKPVAAGGKEVDVLREYFAVSDKREQEFFDNLDEALQIMNKEVEKRESSLTQLIDFLEKQRLIMQSTPTIWPVHGWISSPFGFRASPFSGRRVFHEGLDIASGMGNEVHATAKGIVVFAGERAGYGKLVTIDHGYGYMTRYGHNSALKVKVGDRVNKGDVIAKVGNTGRSTGPHVHYEVLVNSVPVNPLTFIIEEDDEVQ